MAVYDSDGVLVTRNDVGEVVGGEFVPVDKLKTNMQAALDLYNTVGSFHNTRQLLAANTDYDNTPFDYRKDRHLTAGYEDDMDEFAWADTMGDVQNIKTRIDDERISRATLEGGDAADYLSVLASAVFDPINLIGGAMLSRHVIRGGLMSIKAAQVSEAIVTTGVADLILQSQIATMKAEEHAFNLAGAVFLGGILPARLTKKQRSKLRRQFDKDMTIPEGGDQPVLMVTPDADQPLVPIAPTRPHVLTDDPVAFSTIAEDEAIFSLDQAKLAEIRKSLSDDGVGGGGGAGAPPVPPPPSSPLGPVPLDQESFKLKPIVGGPWAQKAAEFLTGNISAAMRMLTKSKDPMLRKLTTMLQEQGYEVQDAVGSSVNRLAMQDAGDIQRAAANAQRRWLKYMGDPKWEGGGDTSFAYRHVKARAKGAVEGITSAEKPGRKITQPEFADEIGRTLRRKDGVHTPRDNSDFGRIPEVEEAVADAWRPVIDELGNRAQAVGMFEKRPGYFPRVWNTQAVLQNVDEWARRASKAFREKHPEISLADANKRSAIAAQHIIHDDLHGMDFDGIQFFEAASSSDPTKGLRITVADSVFDGSDGGVNFLIDNVDKVMTGYERRMVPELQIAEMFQPGANVAKKQATDVLDFEHKSRIKSMLKKYVDRIAKEKSSAGKRRLRWGTHKAVRKLEMRYAREADAIEEKYKMNSHNVEKVALEEYTARYQEKLAEATTEQQRVDLGELYERDVTDFQSMIGQITNRFHLPGTPTGISVGSARFLRGLRELNTSTIGGGFGLSSITDIGKPVIVHGFKRSWGRIAKDYMNPRVWEHIKLTQVENDIFRVGSSFLESVQPFARHDASELAVASKYAMLNKFERGLSNVSRTVLAFAGLFNWNKVNGHMWAHVSQGRLADIGFRNFDGKALSSSDLSILNRLNIGTELLEGFTGQIKKYGEIMDGSPMANVHLWDDEVLKKQFIAAVMKDVDTIIVKPSASDLPNLMQKEGPVKSMLQFKAFGIASISRTMYPALQSPEPHMLNGMAMMFAAGGVVYALKELQKKEDARFRHTDPVSLIYEGLDRSGMFGPIGDIHNTVQRLSGNKISLQRAFGSSGMATRGLRPNTLATILGPSAGKVQQMSVAANALLDKVISGDELTGYEWGQLKRLIPGRNLIEINALLNMTEEALSESERAGLR